MKNRDMLFDYLSKLSDKELVAHLQGGCRFCSYWGDGICRGTCSEGQAKWLGQEYKPKACGDCRHQPDCPANGENGFAEKCRLFEPRRNK